MRQFLISIKYWRKIKSKSQLNELEHENIHIGFLIYDTYIRFYNTPILKIKSIKLLILIYTAIKNLDFYRSIKIKELKINYFTPYTSYIASGSISLGLLHNEKSIISLYSCAFPKKIKKLSKIDQNHSPNFSQYKSIFEILNNKKTKLKTAKILFESRFLGAKDLTYMNVNVYEKNGIILNKNFDGILFLHDFMDAPHDYGPLLFNDFYEWAIKSFEYIVKNDLNIGIKFHPNQTNESKLVVNKLISDYPQLNWINPKISNKVIFDSGIKYGISVFGTVLSELAFHGITPLAAGSNPYESYNFVYNPSSKEEYFDFMKNPKKIKIQKEELFQFYYMNYIYCDSKINYLSKSYLNKIENIKIQDII